MNGGDTRRYRIIRFYFRGGRRVIARGLTYEEALAHCHNPETSSSTAKSPAARRRTREIGPWFDGMTGDYPAVDWGWSMES